MMSRTHSMPVATSARVLRKLRGSEGEMSVMERNNNMWLADNRRNTFFLELSGVNFNDITEETLKKGKVWLKFYQKKEKKTAEVLKKFAKEKHLLSKRQQVQMERLLKDNNIEKTNELKKLTQNHTNNPWETEEEFQQLISVFDEKQAKSVEVLTMHHKCETLTVEKIHKCEKFEHDRQERKENHEYFKKVKKDAHEIQIREYEQYQSNEVIELTKMVQAKQVERILKFTAEMKDGEGLTELQEKLDKEALTKRKQLANTQEIRREQLVAEHKEQMKIVDQMYLKRIKEFELNAQSEIEMLERQIGELEQQALYNSADVKSE
ncbi:sodium channel and clathrin linker 1-like [Bolinopsis microptera]|uniref:sodium channel and clathrin linker 1-like n=1 Tax=Bolinopsis microptera TaxID=2820187 RepID=UPI003079A0E7